MCVCVCVCVCVCRPLKDREERGLVYCGGASLSSEQTAERMLAFHLADLLALCTHCWLCALTAGSVHSQGPMRGRWRLRPPGKKRLVQ